MEYDEAKDIIKKKWHHGDLEVSVRAYNECNPKLQIGPRIYGSADGTEWHYKSGRLSSDEVEWLVNVVLVEALQEMSQE